VKGAVIALPILNLTDFRARQRSSPFEIFNNTDMNRCFPSSPDGGMTEQMAHVVFVALKQNATHFVDSHTAYTSDTRWALYAHLGGEVSRVGRLMAEAFEFENPLPTPEGTLQTSALMAAGREGIPGFLVEAGGIGPAFSRETVRYVAERLRNVARAIGAASLSGDQVSTADHVLEFQLGYHTARRFVPAEVSCGETVRKGQKIGTYYNVFGGPDGDATVPAAGIVLAINAGPIIPQGDVLIHIGLGPKRTWHGRFLRQAMWIGSRRILKR
jgi:predicted deacylase